MSNNVNAAARMDRLPISKWHYHFLVIVVAGMIFDNLDFFVLGGVIAKLQAIGWATKEMAGTMVSANFFGIMAGVVLSGFLVDRFGRKTLYMYNLLIYSIGTIICGFAPNFTALVIFRALTAIGLGGEIAIGYSLIAEYFPPKGRGRLSLFAAVFVNFGGVISYLLGMFVLPLGDGAWRALFIICGIPALYAWWVRRKMPESPRWLENRGRYEEAEKILSGIEAEVEKSTGKTLPPPRELIAISDNTKRSAWEILNAKNIKATILSSFLFVAFFTMNYSLSTWLPTYFISIGINVKSSMFFSVITIMGLPVGMLMAALLIELGRKKVIIGAMIIGAIFAFFYSSVTDINAFVILGFCTMVCIFTATGVGQCCYIPELFPTILRGRGVSLTEGVGRFSTIISPLVVVWAMGKWGFQVIISAVFVIMILVAVLTFFLGKETKSLNLEEINEKDQGMLVM